MIARVLALVALLLLLLTGVREGWTREETDFPNLYTAAVLVREGKPLRDYYDWTSFAREMNYAGHEIRIGAYTPQTPLTMLPIVAIATLPPQRAKQVWLAVNLAVLAMTVWLLSLVTGFRVEHVWLLLCGGFFALANNFVLGQYYVFLLWLLTLACWCMHRSRPAAAGVVAGVAFALKLYGGPFLLYFAARRNWRAVAGMLAAVLGAGALAVALFGAADVRYWLTQILPRSLQGGSPDPYHPGSPTVSALLHRALMREPELNPSPLWHAPGVFFFLSSAAALATGAFTGLGLMMARERDARRDFAWLVVALMLLTTSLSSYSFVLLALPVLLLMVDAGVRARVALVACWVLLAYPLGATWLFPKVWLLLVLFVAVGLDYWRAIRPRVLLATAACVALVAFVDARRHLAGFLEEPGQHFERLAVERGQKFASFPVVTRAGVIYQSMGNRRYVLRRVLDGRIDTRSFEGQALEPRATSAGGPVQFELVANRKSVMMQLDPFTLRASPAPAALRLARPDTVVSPDGKWIAWVSARTGPRHVWLRDVATGRARELTGGNCNSTSPAWELDSERIVFASDCGRAFGLPALYSARIDLVVP